MSKSCTKYIEKIGILNLKLEIMNGISLTIRILVAAD